MSSIFFSIGYIIILIGLAFMLIGSIGIVRLPNFFARTHAASTVDTVGIGIVVVGIAVTNGIDLDSIKVLLAGIFIMLTNPVAANALARAAFRRGECPLMEPKEKPLEKKD